MHLFDIIAILISLAALFSWFNHKFLKLPATIGLMLIALVMSLVLLSPLPGTTPLELDVKRMLDSIAFDEAVLHGMLSFLLFAGAMHVRFADLKAHKWVILLLATVGVLISALLVGLLAWVLFLVVGLDVPFIYCMMFAALIAPTDPIAVLSILKQAGAPKSLETKITGESLFNDGVAVVLFLLLFDLATGEADLHLGSVAMAFLTEAVGGVLFGLAAGGLAVLLVRSIDDYKVEVLITLAIAAGAYAAAEHWHLSAPITVVVAGLLVGNLARTGIMSDLTLQYVDGFWELVDEVLNAVLFVLIGLEVMVLVLTGQVFLAGALAIPLVLAVRAFSTWLPIAALGRFRTKTGGVVAILTWGGLRGGISVAMALSLPDGPARDVVVAVTYLIVVFSILVQGLTLGPVIRAVGRRADLELDYAAMRGEVPPDADAGQSAGTAAR